MLQDLSSHIVMTESLEKLSGRWQVSYVPLSGKRTSPVQLVAQCCPTLRPHGLQHARLACPSPTPRACSNSCQLSRWCHPNISSSVIPFSCCLPSFPTSGSFPVSQFFASGGQSIGAPASASVLPMNIQDWFPLGLTGLISLCYWKQCKEMTRHPSHFVLKSDYSANLSFSESVGQYASDNE